MPARLPSTPPVLSGYTYIRPLGTGGFADVFLFEQNMPRRSVAVKVLLQDVVDADVLRMFNAEADVMARLSSHPSILTVYNASISADGRPYLVMEFCPGSLSSRYRREQINLAEILHLAVKIACALETAHRSGVLHRDIKPSNILTTSFGAPVLADFGIATSLGSSNREQLFAMSVPWSAPEVVDEHTTGTVHSEVWAFGATVYSLLAGRTPFEVEGVKSSREQVKSRIMRARYTPIGRADIPPELEQILARTMNRVPEHRQGSLIEVAQNLQHIQYQLGIQPTPLEVAGDEWAMAGGAVDFANSTMRGPVISEVVVDSKRPSRASRLEAKATIDDGTMFVDSPRSSSGGSRGLLIGLVAGGLVLGVGATIGLLALLGVI